MADIQVIPLKKIPNQKLYVVLGEQNCTLHVYQRKEYLYLDLSVNNTAVITGTLCGVNRDLVTFGSAFFSGMLYFVDLSGANGRPVYDLLEERFILCYSTDQEE